MRLGFTRRFSGQYQSAAASSLAIAALTFGSYQLHFNAATVVLLYLLVIVLQSLAGGFLASAIIAVAAAGCLDFFFLPPILSFQISDPFNILALFVFLAIALVVTRLVSRVGVEAQRAERHSMEVEQLYEVARQLLLLTPDQVGGIAALKVFREVMGAAAVCLFDASTSEIGTDGTSRHDLAERTRQAYIFGKDTDDLACGLSVRCLRIGSAMTGAIGFEGLPGPKTISPAFAVLAAAALDRADTFRRASHESAAAQAEAFRTAILDALAHEFKTPLATILAVIGGIREARSLEPEHREMAGMIETEILRLSRLTTRLLRTARVEQEELKPHLRSLDIVPFVERVVHRYMHHSREHRTVTTAYCASVETPADPQLLDLALTQLLDNAFKYSLPASAIAVSVQAEDGFVTTSVKNAGTSIAPDEEIRIFERFYRGARVRNLVSGTGLGLYVARKIAAAHGGSLSLINDVPGKGVVFSLKLPMVNDGGHNFPASH
ncbi:MAG: ATP-binding protein [Bryobacteraceae bacterium]|jgi:two-component system sensor histidine kinase KdpD